MKYNINLNQLALASTSLDIKDAAILDYIISICTTVNERVEKQRIHNEKGIWTWIDYSTLAEEMPLLRLNNKMSISDKIRKIFEEGFIDYMRVDNRKIYVKLTDKVDELNFITAEMVNNHLKEQEATISNNLPTISNNLQYYKPKLTNNNINIIHTTSAKKKRENIGNVMPLIEQELTPTQLYRVSELKNIQLPDVIRKYYDIRKLIESGGFNPKWGKDLYLVLCNWLGRDIREGKLSLMDDVQKEINNHKNPDKYQRGKDYFEIDIPNAIKKGLL